MQVWSRQEPSKKPVDHADLGFLDHGTVRFGVGCFSTDEDIDQALAARAAISRVLLAR
jgi:hypothetical protein